MPKHQPPKDKQHHPRPRHITLQPGRMEKVPLGTYTISDGPPQFSIATNPPGRDVTHKPMQLVDFDTMTYELIYTIQSFAHEPLEVTITWSGGQLPVKTKP